MGASEHEREDRGTEPDSVERVEREAWEGAEDRWTRVRKGGEDEAEEYPAAAEPRPSDD